MTLQLGFQQRLPARARQVHQGGAIETMSHPERGPVGGELATDIAWLREKDAPAVLVLISGTHGVKGFCGSGAQVDWLRRGGPASTPKGVAVMLVHAVNPYGFAWLRRVTHENVDLNRNWIDFTGPAPPNPGYAELADAICPHEWNDAARAMGVQALGGYVAAHGAMAMQQAVSALILGI